MAQCFQSVDLSWPGLMGLVFMILVLLMNSIAFSTNHWGIIKPVQKPWRFDEGFMGVLLYCKDSRCERYLDDQFLDVSTDVGMTQMTRASATLTMVAMLINFFALLQLTYSVGRKGNAGVVFDVAVANIIVGILSLASFAVFLAMLAELRTFRNIEKDYDFETGYSLGLSISSWIFSWIAGAIFFLETRSLVYMEVQNVREGGRGFFRVSH